MKTVGIICEYNPFHRGHAKQLSRIDGHKVCLMSGHFVQRGEPAVVDKSLRAAAALQSGADLVLELPITGCLSSAEGFARLGVGILGGFCHQLSFGAEHPELVAPMAAGLLHPDFDETLRGFLATGISFPAARQKALEALGYPAPESPNDILAAEYCKAIARTGSPMAPAPIHRGGDYGSTAMDFQNPSATAIRLAMEEGREYGLSVPEAGIYRGAALHFLKYGEKAMLYRLRTMTDEEFQALPYGSEGLWRRLMHACREQATAEEILNTVKTKRYTRSRLCRMMMCACLGITDDMLCKPIPYVRVLGFNETGRQILKSARQSGEFVNIGTPMEGWYADLENRAADLYGLFAQFPEPPGTEHTRRVIAL